ncbi:TonB-dependent receptor [Parabacteroides sp. PF5-9]|uniref:SusC/RagA family TonB-linked outer membrane protein n=1 Tax=Parabacteroides sp. PF5-9 TaxID=1742404 RepID=UPI002475541A|nr:TonB-dependent receptor [Parabacteroides sp. PF5-9]MDH6356936.1 TonB-linked SusC/RagA family outer membrane protein [Parabacteroides sp. PF5-9]
MKKIIYLLCCLILGIGLLSAQTTQVTGLITSADDGEPIIGASVVAKGTSVGTVTDLDGRFTLNVPSTANTLVISYVGMITQEAKVAPTMNIRLKSDTQLIDEVVVTGYGVIKKGAFTGAAQVVSNESLTRRTDDNIMKSLQGTVAGLQVSSFTGQPGAYSATTIRGTGSFNSGTEPLYVIDGVAVYTEKMGTYNAAGSGDMAASPMANINPNDIESITVLKDATATAIYGARAANGVIVVTTKKGKTGKPRVNFNAKVGSSFVGKLDHNYRTVNLDKYKEIWQEGYINAGWVENPQDAAAELAGDIEYYYGVDINAVESVDWLDAVLDNGFTQEYDLNVQGGNESLNYYASGSYYDTKGVMIGTGMKRYTGRFSLDAKADRLTYGLSASGGLADIDNSMTESQYINPIVAVYDLRPFEQIYNPDGTYNLDAYYNPVAINDKHKGDIRNQKQITMLVNPYFTYRIIDGLTWKTNAGLHIIDLEEFFYNSKYNPQYSDSGLLGQRNNERATTYQITNTLNFNRTFNTIHNVNVLLGQEAQKVAYKRLYASASGYPSDAVVELETASTPTGAESMSKASTLASFFVNGEYDYKNRYYASASFRYDGSSRFGTNNKWAPFWSVGLRYRISEEAFMENTKSWLTDLAARASFGTVGNQDIGYFEHMGLYQYGYSYNSKPGDIPYQVGNKDLKWERVEKFDVGVSGVLFERLSFELDYYNENTKDMLFEVPLSYTTGFPTMTQNVGTMRNRGFEFMLNMNVMNTRDFAWDVRLTGTANKNKITKMSTELPIEGTRTIRKVGEAYHTFYLPEWAGVDPETGDPLWYKGKEGKETTNNINEAEQRIVGSADPKFYGGIGMTFRYKGFDLSWDASYTLGNKVYNSGFGYDMQVGHYYLGPVSNYIYDNRWQKPGDITDVPKFTAGSRANANAESTRFLMSGSHLRMKSIVLGYTLPKSLLRPAGIDNLRVYVSADNLFTITASDYIGFDPQTRANGVQSWAYPVPRNVMFGLNVSF